MRTSIFRVIAAALGAVFLFSGHALAQGAVSQMGPSSAGQTPMYVDGSGHVLSVGGALLGQPPAPSVNPNTLPGGYAAVNPNIGFSLFSGYANAPYSSVGWGFDGSGNFLLDIERIGGGSPPGCTIRIGGIDYPCIGQVSGVATVATNAALALTSTASAPFIIRQDYSTAFGAPPLSFVAQTGTCAANSMTNDGGSCTNATGGNSWKAVPAGDLRVEWWGIAAATPTNPIMLYVNSAGSNANANTCLIIANPCASGVYAVSMAQKFDVGGGNVIIKATDTTTWNDAESIMVTNPLRGAGSNAAVPDIGNLWPSQIIFDGNSHWVIAGFYPGGACYGLAASNNAIIGVRNITIAPIGNACQDGLFAQLGGGINMFGGVTLGATGANGCKAHAENTSYGIQIWEDYTITGNGNCVFSIGNLGNVLISAGVGTITGTPTLVDFMYNGPGGVFQTNIANPWGGVPGAISGYGFLNSIGASITTNGNAVTWPVNLSGGYVNILQGGAFDFNGGAAVPTATGDAAIGSTGTLAVSSGSNPYDGVVTITAGGAGLSTGGTITVTVPFFVRHANGATAQCTANAISNGSWPSKAVMHGGPIVNTAGVVTFPLTWDTGDGSNLIAASTYPIAWHCLNGG
jgi:hypothetical protein